MKSDTRSDAWQFWIDRGGTFTDVIGLAPGGVLHVRKVLSAPDRETGAAAAPDPGLAAVRALLGAAAPRAGIAALKVGTTVATNALLERRGTPTVLVTTRGFADQLRIGYQNRPDIFALDIRRPEVLWCATIEAAERIAVDGRVVEPLDERALETALRAARAAGLESAAIVFMHGWCHGAHEARAAAIARGCGFAQVSVSHEVAPLVRFVARGDTTVLDAYLTPPLQRFARSLASGLEALDRDARLYFMQSGGGLALARDFRAGASVLSGPAGGLAGMAKIAAALGLPRLIGFDMGGTSTDVSLLDGEIPVRFEHEIAGIRLQAPMLDIHTIAAGGGSVVEFRDGRLTVGPHSAGADPGPACYGRGGPLALTDLQVALGRLQPQFLPALFGADGGQGIDCAATRSALETLAARTAAEVPGATALSVAQAALDVAVEAMANAIRHVATRHGADPGDFALFCFGGAAGQHACRVAQACGMQRVLVHPLASVLSAFGIGVADRLAVRRASLRAPLDRQGLRDAQSRLDQLVADARRELAHPDGDAARVAVRRVLEIRAGESETTLDVDVETPGPEPEPIAAAFAAIHRRRFGYQPVDPRLLIEQVRVEARDTTPLHELHIAEAARMELPRSVRAWFGAWIDAPVHEARQLRAPVVGPALLVDAHSTLAVEPGWTASRGTAGTIIVERQARVAAQAGRDSAGLDPARLEIFNALFMHIAEEMGAVLRQTAQSVNIKERLDYSCAVFDGAGRLIANAPHMPVHLGSMGTSVRAVLAAHGSDMHAGDAWMLNSPYHGGTHLPDITVVTPVFLGGAHPDFFVASRAHHADVGGTTPGSMPPFSRSIDEEGVLITDFQIVAGGQLRERELLAALTSAPWPPRNVSQNVADLRAQLAANARGLAELERAVRRHGLDVVRTRMAQVRDNAAECVRRAIERLRPGACSLELDGGQRIAVRVDVDHRARRARIDFTGTSAAGPHNFNAPRSVAIAAVLYVFRTLLERPIPLNEGCLEPLELVIPGGSMLDPAPPAAVVAGNVETSQCIVDALYAALGVLAASQGTMNNLTFGNERLQYYETIAGGAGAGPGFDGCAAVQTHMTNSRITDPEILESRYPVLVREFAIRRGSGGAGRHRGGDGAIRRIEFRAALSGAMLANRRRTVPFGLDGGEPGAPGRTRLVRADGTVTDFDACANFDLRAGDTLEVLTPGGGGYGRRAE
jgi:5-oxoprolinase (ATP-hydrolysing)